MVKLDIAEFVHGGPVDAGELSSLVKVWHENIHRVVFVDASEHDQLTELPISDQDSFEQLGPANYMNLVDIRVG